MPRRLTLPAILCLASLALAGPVAADCEPAGPLEAVLPDAPVVFVGTVSTVDGGSARFAVEEVWAGAVGPDVDVHGLGWAPVPPDLGGQGRAPVERAVPGMAFVEDDRVWEVGRRYLVIPSVEGDILRDHQCTATTEWRPELAELRPADAVLSPDEPDGGIPVPLIVAAAAVLVLAAGSALAFRRG
jgi:hypothetical protein